MESDPPPLSRGARGKEARAAAGSGRKVFEGVLWILKTGAQWHMMLQCYPNYKTAHRRFQKWCRAGVLENALRDLAGELRESRRIDGSEAFIDASFARAKGGGPDVGKTKSGKGMKIMAIADRSGLPLSVSVHAANHHETKLAQLSLDLCLCGKPANLIGDKAYDSDPLDAKLRQQGVEMIAPHRRNRKRPKTQDGRRLRRYKRRWIVERFFAWLQWSRRVLVRWEYHMENFLGFVQTAALCMLLKHF